MEPAGAHPGHGFRPLHCDFLVSLLVLVAEFVLVSGNRVSDRQEDVLPDVGSGIFQIDHDGGRSGVQQFYRQRSVIGRPGHLIALIRAPVRYFDPPIRRGCLRGRQIARRISAMRRLQHFRTLGDDFLLPRRELLVQRQQEIKEALGEVLLGIQVRWRVIHVLHRVFSVCQAGRAGRFRPAPRNHGRARIRSQIS